MNYIYFHLFGIDYEFQNFRSNKILNLNFNFQKKKIK
jgi:hypothetical protein